jgi:hypothetical protein
MGASYTASTSGWWDVAATWGGQGVPGNGDTATINDGVTVTIRDARVIGNSPNAGNVVLSLGNSGAVIIAAGGTLQLRGDMEYAAGGGANTSAYMTVEGGGILEFDSSQAASPFTTNYSAYPDGTYSFRGVVTAGTYSNRATVRSNTAGGNGYFGLAGHPNGGVYSLAYTDFLRIGDSTNPAFSMWSNGTNTSWVALHNTFTSCGLAPAAAGSLAAGEVFRHDYNVHAGSLASTVFTRGGTSPALTSGGVREVVGNVFDIAADSGFDGNTFIIHSNYFGGGFGLANSSSVTWSLFENNFYITQRGTGAGFVTLLGNSQNNYWFLSDPYPFNPHGVNVGAAATRQSITGDVVDHAGQINDQVSAFDLNNVPSPNGSAYTLRNCILLPNAAGHSSFWLGGVGNSWANNESYSFIHNTAMIDSYLGGMGLITAHATTPPDNPGQLASYENNILWNPVTTNEAYKLLAAQNVNLNVCAPANCDYNDGWNMRTDGGGFTGGASGYADNFSGGTPGTHDLAVDPMFADTTRNLATFDSAYLDNAAPVWNAGATYNVGDVVSSSDPSVYSSVALAFPAGGAVINYRYTNGAGCSGSNPQPGLLGGHLAVSNGSTAATYVSGQPFLSTWAAGGQVSIYDGSTGNYDTYTLASATGTSLTFTSPYAQPSQSSAAYVYLPTGQCWEWASLYDIRQAVAGQSLYEDNSIGVYGNDIITTLVQWIRAGFSPGNSALAQAGSDGQDIGAVPVSVPWARFPSGRTGGSGARERGVRGGIVR